MKKVFIKFKNLGKNLRNIYVDLVADVVDPQPLFNNPLSIPSFSLTGQGIQRDISDNATKLYLIPQYNDYFVSGGNPSILEVSQLKFTNVKNLTFLNNPLYTAEVSSQNYLSQYMLWKSGSTPRWNLTNNDPLINGGIFTRGYTGTSITGQFIGVGTGYSGTTINIYQETNNKLKVYNTPGISGFAGTYTSGIYNINGTLRTGFKNDNNLIGTGGGFFIFKNTSPNEWRAVELNSGSSLVQTWYRNSGNDTFGYYQFIPPVTGWQLGQNINQRFGPVPETYFGTCNGYTFLYPETVFRVNSFDRNLSFLKFYSGGLLNDNGTSSIFTDNITIEDLFPTAYGEFFNKKFFYSNIVNNDRYYLFNSIDTSSNYLKWYVAKISPSGSKYDYWVSDFIDVNSNMTLGSASTGFYPINNDSASNFSIFTLSKYLNIRLSESKNINIENYSGYIYLDNPIFTQESILVENGGNQAANGIYVPSGAVNGSIRYVSTTSPLYDIINDVTVRRWSLRQFHNQQYYTIYSSNIRFAQAPTGTWISRSAIVPQFAPTTGFGNYILRSSIVNNYIANDACINDSGTVIIVANGPSSPLSETIPIAIGSITIYTGNNNFAPKQTIVGSHPILQPGPSTYDVTNGFANSVDISSNGSIIAIGGYNVKIYRGNPNGSGQDYVLQQTINTPYTSWNVTDNNIAINGDGNVLVVGSPYSDSGNGRVQIYRVTGNNLFGIQQTIIGGYNNMNLGFGFVGGYGGVPNGGCRFGDYVSLSTNGNVLAVGGYVSGRGSAHVFERPNTGSFFSTRYIEWGDDSIRLGKWTTSVNDDGSVVCIGGYGGTILRRNPSTSSFVRLNRNERSNILNTTPIFTNGDGSKIIIGGYAGQAAIIYTGNKNLTHTNSGAFWRSGYALNLTGFESTPGINFYGTSDMNVILVRGLRTNLYSANNIIPIITGNIIITGTSPAPESTYTQNYLVDNLNDMYEFKKINSGKYSGPYFEGTNYIFANPEFKIDSYSGLDHLLLKGANVVPSGVSGTKLYQINSTFLGNNIYTDLDQTYILWKSGNSQRWNLTNNDPLIDGIFRGGFTGLVNVTEPFTGFNTSIGQFRASGSGFSGSFNIFPIGKLITGARCSNTGARIWTILDKNYNYVGWRNCNSGSGTFIVNNWGTGNPMSSFNFSSMNFNVIEFYKHKNSFINGTNYLLGSNTGFDYSTVSGVFNLNTGDSFQFNFFNDPVITTTINYKNSGLYHGNINNLPMSFGLDGNYFSAYSSGNIARINIQIGNQDVGYAIFRSGNNATIDKFALSRAIIICR